MVRLDYVVQQSSYREMKAFVQLAKALEAVDLVAFGRVINWGTWSASEFEIQSI